MRRFRSLSKILKTGINSKIGDKSKQNPPTDMLAMNPYKRSCPERQENHSALQHALHRINELECEVVEKSRMIYCLEASHVEVHAQHREEIMSRQAAVNKMLQDTVVSVSENMALRDDERDSARNEQVRAMIDNLMRQKMEGFHKYVDEKEAAFKHRVTHFNEFVHEKGVVFKDKVEKIMDFYERLKVYNANLGASTKAPSSKSVSTSTNTPTGNRSIESKLLASQKALRFSNMLVKTKQKMFDSLKGDMQKLETTTNDNIKGMEAKVVDFGCNLQELLETNRSLRTLITDNESWVVGDRPLCEACVELSTRVYEPYLGELARDSARWFKLLPEDPEEERLDTMLGLERARRKEEADE